MQQGKKDPIFDVAEEDHLTFCSLLYQKDYSSEALNFIDNHARILNYWKEGEHSLLPDQDDEKGRRKFSFIDLVWLGMVKELRDLGMGKKAISNLKQALFDTSGLDMLHEQIDRNPDQILYALQSQLGITALQAKTMLDLIEEKKDELAQFKTSYLLQYIMFVLIRRRPLHVLINKDGNHVPCEEDTDLTIPGNLLIKEVKRSAHISLCVNTIVGKFLSKSYIQEKLTDTVYSKEERKLIGLLRKGTPRSVTVYFKSNGKMDRMDITQELKINGEARLKEFILAGGYENIEIVTENGKPVSAKKTQKHKL
ncbi:MerR family transcriptional regulator [Flaviaesturariibacter amylovorans]|uniref:HTH merR-type domain-containing protein n=1 Tax=Flaviaesturariibacter amylovorans TaxID=1084520 RepID=A0ABP8H543_9BACT